MDRICPWTVGAVAPVTTRTPTAYRVPATFDHADDSALVYVVEAAANRAVSFAVDATSVRLPDPSTE